MISKRLLQIVAATFVVSSGIAHAQIQNSSTDINGPAAGVVRKAIALMGGQAWSAMKAATVQATVTYGNGDLVSMEQSDDWSGDRVLHRSDTMIKDRTQTTIDGARGISVTGAPKAVTLSANYDLSRLAHLYPAAALSLALDRKCQFRQLADNNAKNAVEKNAIIMDCYEPQHVGQKVTFKWWFDEAGLPKRAQIPMAGMLNPNAYDETVQYGDFQSSQGLSTPSQIQVLKNQRIIYTETLSRVSFLPALLRTKFNPASSIVR